ncbi:hypothetical protein LCGC14_2804860 [marine sediment metagenome]|uniref:Uncharacterized protein n=1 Tax=marine sediment metagenome TaxID=412755 RepID=A0A0F9BCY3_9ZZZZ
MELIVVSLSWFIFVFVKAFQQRNVNFLNYWWVPPFSYLMAITQVLVIGVVSVRANKGAALDSPNEIWLFFLDVWPLVFVIGTAGWLGSTLAMFLHNKYIK